MTAKKRNPKIKNLENDLSREMTQRLARVVGSSQPVTKSATKLKFHPIADAFPLLSDDELDDLAQDIAKHGQRMGILLHEDGSILDGRNRYLACLRAGVEPRTTTYTGKDAVAIVVSANLKRRHLNTSQRSMIAAKLANMTDGRPSKTTPIGVVSKSEAAKQLNVGTGSVDRAKAVQRDGVPELVKAVETGQLSIAAASEIAKQPKEQQRQMIADGPEEATKRAIALRNAKDEAGKKFNPKKEVAEDPAVRWSNWVARAQSLIPYCPSDCVSKLSKSSRQQNAKRVRQFIETLEGCLDALESPAIECVPDARATEAGEVAE